MVAPTIYDTYYIDGTTSATSSTFTTDSSVCSSSCVGESLFKDKKEYKAFLKKLNDLKIKASWVVKKSVNLPKLCSYNAFKPMIRNQLKQRYKKKKEE
jgi:hypothetical protein